MHSDEPASSFVCWGKRTVPTTGTRYFDNSRSAATSPPAGSRQALCARRIPRAAWSPRRIIPCDAAGVFSYGRPLSRLRRWRTKNLRNSSRSEATSISLVSSRSTAHLQPSLTQ
ncbi:hypothetical protein EVAR_79881_1 [Eumeta japonica]|uniref:Uncharacterized protein n=1 Tax=Eumeta variegata TaxID=151549 RepID=A0A4C1TYX8_EUMVA|nr:hypothetical protein EVAR_79881_1 [Eumeta japonica]